MEDGSVVIILLFISLLFSAVLSIFTLTKTQKKWVALVAFCGNSVVLAGLTWIIYISNEELRLFGFGHSPLSLLPLFIPVITWINYFILELIKKFSKWSDSSWMDSNK
ncbi:hypothetical protein C2I17_16235 [Niallia circulans]|uniref:hypothetical protein n=1 Tax=Niallia circulans TaxID=1397 RepID=UPI00201E2639|nr:hypothetical protein [Niallia circulans]UQZ75972.1 hypothetical protein C2I17_16235 [Niallia circulans]